VAFACLHFLSETGNGTNAVITVQMSNDPDHCQVKGGSGGGPNYGSITPPRLVQ
jgi:hypothetical protein